MKVVSFAHIEQYLQLFTNPRWAHAIVNSLFMTVISALSCTVVAFIFAYTISRLDIPFKGLFKLITILPIVSPPFIVSMSYILLFGRQGMISKNLLHLNLDIYGWQGLWLVQTISFFPFAYAVIYDVLKNSSPSLEYAAYNLGASHLQVFTHIVLPLCKPGIAGGALIAAMSVLADFGNPMVIGGNFTVLSTEAYMAMTGRFDLASAAVLSTALFVPAICLFLVNKMWVGKRSYVTVTGKESYSEHYPIPSFIKWVLFAFCLLLTTIILLIYGVLFYGAFTKTWGFDWSLTITNLDYVFSKGKELFNSIQYAVLSSVLAGTLGFLLAYLVQKKKAGLNRLLDFLAVLPGAVPGVFLGLGFAIAFNKEPIMLTGTSAIMVFALTIWNLPTCYSALLAGLQQISDSLEEASHNLGAGSTKTFRNILLPLMRGPFVSVIVVSFLRSVTCLSVLVFIYSAKTSVGTISILGLGIKWGVGESFSIYGCVDFHCFCCLRCSPIFLEKDKEVNCMIEGGCDVNGRIDYKN